MARTPTEIPDDLLKQANDNPEMQESIAAEVGVSKKTLQKRIKKVNLATSFVADTGDTHDTSFIDEQSQPQEVTPVDYDAVAKSAIWMLDGFGFFAKNIGNVLLKAKGKEVEYEVMSNSEKEFMVAQLKSQPQTLDYLAKNDFMMPLLAFGSILATFVMHFKVKDKEESPTEKKGAMPKPEKKKIEDIKLNIKTNTLHKVDEIPDSRKKEEDFLE